jgi:hypothetical protein
MLAKNVNARKDLATKLVNEQYGWYSYQDPSLDLAIKDGKLPTALTPVSMPAGMEKKFPAFPTLPPEIRDDITKAQLPSLKPKEKKEKDEEKIQSFTLHEVKRTAALGPAHGDAVAVTSFDKSGQGETSLGSLPDREASDGKAVASAPIRKLPKASLISHTTTQETPTPLASASDSRSLNEKQVSTSSVEPPPAPDYRESSRS